ncbi:polypeptide N-acetylgalactosaminyltransferase 7 [Turdus rufiventris]|nr:polypeptide N-acetylgalactosaminyltransferase 7 [Turdus rufiventris]
MRLKLGFLLRAVLLAGSFLGLLLLWSSLSTRAEEPDLPGRTREKRDLEYTGNIWQDPQHRMKGHSVHLGSSENHPQEKQLSMMLESSLGQDLDAKLGANGCSGPALAVNDETLECLLTEHQAESNCETACCTGIRGVYCTSPKAASCKIGKDDKEANRPLPNKGDHGLGNEKFKPVVPWPHVEGVEVDLESIRRKNKAKNELNHHGVDNKQQNIIQRQYLTFKPQTFVYPDPVLRPGVLGNFEPKEPEPHGVVGGPGEEAKPYVLGPDYKESVQASIKEFGFNMVASDMISLDRSVNDLRQEESPLTSNRATGNELLLKKLKRCKYWHYDDNLLTSSVVIVFHNEGWSTLMRTVHSVIKRTPRKYLAEIVLIDDFSNKAHLQERLDDYIKQWNGLVKVFRNERREGLIQARSIGAQKAKLGQVLVYLDAHCEVGINWYAPLIAPISKDRTTCTVPLIDYIDGNDYSIEPQQGGDEDGFARGAWDWSLLWKRIPLSHKEKSKRKHKTEPYRSPAMAGGLFAIERDFFFELGLYDPGLQIWGGENFEISYKIWQCGGKLLFVPCSRVGHIYRLQGWQGNPPPVYVGSSPTLKNYVRVVEVWWDEYKDYFYASRPETKALPYGDISELKKFREDHNCKSFKWFMEEIAYDITSYYPLPPKNVEWGEAVSYPMSEKSCPPSPLCNATLIAFPNFRIRGFETSYCIDSMGHTNGGFVELGPCHRMGGNQLFRINEANQLMQYDQCLTKGPDGSKVMITHCNQNEFKEWQFFKNLHRFTHIPSGKCLDRSEVLHQVFISECDSSKATQKWEINNILSV